MFLAISEIVGGALDRKKTKQIKKATDKIAKNKKKLSPALKSAKKKNKETSITQKFYAMGVGITFALNISNKIINNIANIFIK